MKKGLDRKGLVFSIIVLFIGVGIQPAFAEQTITTTLDSEEDCGNCQVSDGYSLLRTKILLFKVRIVTNIILLSRFDDIPEIKENCQEILDVINHNEPLYDRPICNTLASLIYSIYDTMTYIEDLMEQTSNKFIQSILFSIHNTLLGNLVTLNLIGLTIDCWDEWGPERPESIMLLK